MVGSENGLDDKPFQATKVDLQLRKSECGSVCFCSATVPMTEGHVQPCAAMAASHGHGGSVAISLRLLRLRVIVAKSSGLG